MPKYKYLEMIKDMEKNKHDITWIISKVPKTDCCIKNTQVEDFVLN